MKRLKSPKSKPKFGTFQAYALMEKELGRIAEARDLFERGLKADPTNAYLYQAYGQIEAEQKRWRRGLALIQRGIAATGEQDAPLFQFLGRILARLRRFDQAEVAFHRGLAISPAHAPIFQEWAFVKAKKGDKEAIENLLRDGCIKCPGDLLLHMTLAQFLVSTGRQDEAEPFMKRALELCGSDQLRRQETERRILLQPFRMGEPPGFRFVALDQEGVVEQLVPIEPRGGALYGFIVTATGSRLYFRLPKDQTGALQEHDRVIYDVIEYIHTEVDRLVAINIEIVNDD